MRLPRRLAYPMIGLLSLLLWAAVISAALAQTGQPSNCSGTATNTAAAIVFPTSGQTGPSSPSQFVTIANPDASATLWINATKGGTATAATAGSIALSPVGATGVGQNGISFWRGFAPVPNTISILSSAGSSPFTCWYQ